ncbi:MAG: threonyl-tRNA synthetase editing domain-containing protein [Nanoarchaeota archaeon]
MKLLILDCSSFGFELDHKTKIGEEIGDLPMKERYDNCLVVFVSIEKEDSVSIVKRVGKDLIDICGKNGRKTIFLNPFAHLSSSLANSKQSLEIIKAIEIELKDTSDLNVARGLFGWYKKFDISVEGHGNSQIFKEY